MPNLTPVAAIAHQTLESTCCVQTYIQPSRDMLSSLIVRMLLPIEFSVFSSLVFDVFLS